jgi:hypothetical protein
MNINQIRRITSNNLILNIIKLNRNSFVNKSTSRSFVSLQKSQKINSDYCFKAIRATLHTLSKKSNLLVHANKREKFLFKTCNETQIIIILFLFFKLSMISFFLHLKFLKS